ncbi:TPA: MFS transporter [bacterium]|nr:MFS transporter [bacterium]
MKVSYVRYALGILALSMISQLYHSYNYSFYVDELGLAVALATLTKIIFIGFDAINDMFIARFSDRTETKRGKRTPWLLYCAPYLAIALVISYLPDKQLDKSLLFVYYLITSLIFEVFATIMYINYGALFPIIYKSETERANASITKQFFSFIGMVIGAALPPFLFNHIGYRLTAIIYAIIYIIIMYICISGLHETSFEYKKKFNNEEVKLFDAFKNTYQNKRFIFYNLAQAFSLSVNSIILTIFPFYAEYSIKISKSQQTLLWFSLFLGTFASLPIWRKTVIKNGFNNTWMLSFVIYAFTLLTLLFAYDFNSGLFAAFLIGIGLAGVFVTPDLIMAYIIDLDFKKHQVHREASFMAISNFVQKLSLAISVIVVWGITSIFGFVSGDNPGDHPGLTFSVLMGLIPVVLLAIGYIFVKKYINYDNTHID